MATAGTPLSGQQHQAWAVLLEKIGLSGGPAGQFQAALMHRSWINECQEPRSAEVLESNERLEFLGDAVLGLVIARKLYQDLPGQDEGSLSKAKAHLVSTEILARHARQLDLGAVLLLGRGEELSGGRSRDSILADALEALIGAIFLSQGLEAVERFVLPRWQTEFELETAKPGDTDFKSLLQELSQKVKGELPVYQVEQVTGPDHNRNYEISVVITGREYGRGLGHSKKEAAQVAAAAALIVLREEAGK